MILTARPADGLYGTARVPGDKSCSHRALIFAALAEGTSRISGLLESDDTAATARALGALGVECVPDGAHWRVTGGPWRSPGAPLDCGNSGTAARLLLGALAGRAGVEATLTGDSSLSRRPMERVVAPLRAMGAAIEGGPCLPITVRGRALGPLRHRNLPPSAQVKSALLLAGLGAHGPLEIVEPVPTRDHSEILFGEMGVALAMGEGPDGWHVALGEQRALRAADIAIAADPSSAAFALVAGLLVANSTVRVEGMLVNPHRTGLYETLERMGARIALSNERRLGGEIVADIEIAQSDLSPCHVAAPEVVAMIDEIPLLAVAAAFADGESVIAGLGELRVKESDRLGAILAGLVANGVAAAVDGDCLRVFGRGFASVRGGGRVSTHGDHRIAMAFLVLGLAARRPVEVDEAQMIATSFPGFVETMRALGAEIA